jgi:hypothetical protein
MISFFKKETKELKERKRLEKKLQKDSKVLSSSSSTQPNVNLSNLIVTAKTGDDQSDSIKNASISMLINKFENVQQPTMQVGLTTPTTPPRSKTGVIRGMSKFYGLPHDANHQDATKPVAKAETNAKYASLLLNDVNGEFKLPPIEPVDEYIVRELAVKDYDCLVLNRATDGSIICDGLYCLLPGLSGSDPVNFQ